MAAAVTISADADGRTLAELARLVELREKYMKNELTRDAVTATAVNVLSSIRARAKVAKVKSAEKDYKIYRGSGVVAGWKNHRRVVRLVGGHTVASAKVINAAGGHQRGEKVAVFTVLFKNERLTGKIKGENYDRIYIIARNETDARSWARKRLESYIKQYTGMVKWAIGEGQRQIVAQSFSEDEETPSRRAQAVGLKNTIVKVTGDGFDKGQFSIEYKNTLDYATLALKGGAADVELALKKAANRTAGIINKVSGAKLTEKISTPFPEVKGSKR